MAIIMKLVRVNRKSSMSRANLGIHGLKSWGRNLSRKVRETPSSRSRKRPECGQEVLAARGVGYPWPE